MKPATLVLVLIFFSVQSLGQTIHKAPIRDHGLAKSYPIDGTPFLQKQYEEAAEYVRAHPDFENRSRLLKQASAGDTLGRQRNLYVFSFSSNSYYQTPSTCRKVGTHCYIFVEDSLWTDGRAGQSAVDSIENDFDNKTPANPSEGIYDMDTGAFGNPPDVDSDPKIFILICNVQEGYNGSGGYIAGFFDPNQETGYNNMEIYYVDANPTDLTTSDGIELAMSTAAHEFQHMIAWNYHKTSVEPTFVNEGCSMLAELYCGYPPEDLSLYANETNIYLFNWRDNNDPLVLNDYARAQRFHLYLWDRYGIGLFKYIAQNTNTNPVTMLNSALSSYGVSEDFNHIFSNWLIANELNDTTSNRLYGYAYKNLPVSNGRTYYNPNVSSTDTVRRVGCRYLIFKGGSNLNATFTNPTNSVNLSVVAIEMGSGTENVVSVPFSTPFSEAGFGSTYTTVAFAVINADPTNDIIYSYQASGTTTTSEAELKWDITEPSGYYLWSTSDSVCVTFDAYPGGTLDSIRVALRRPGSIIGGIYQLATSGSSPLGKLLTKDTATINTSITLTNGKYPVPWPNWTSVNLSGSNISTDSPFAVAFVIGEDPSTPGVMVTDYSSTSSYHSFTYINASEASPDPAGWYYISSATDTIALYLIRAYVRFTTGVTQEVSPMPIQFNLGQNYPNPFNPTTAINYQLSATGFVTLSVYDILGREVALLVNEREPAGRHSVRFDASGLPSGTYFYRLATENDVSVKKMVVIK